MATVQCPQCKTEFDQAAVKACPNPDCGYPVELMEEDSPKGWEPDQYPRPKPPPTPPPPPSPPDPPVQPDTQPIPPLPPPQPPPQPAPPVPAVPPRPGGRPLLVLAAGAAVVLLVGVIAFALAGGDGPPSQVAAVDPSLITVTPRCLIPPPDGSSTHDAENTLDGDRDTAWNCRLEPASTSTVRPVNDVTLVYRFARPVRLARIDLVNGFARTARLFDLNARVREVTITTDTQAVTTTLSDSSQPQQVAADFGVTNILLFRVQSVYPGNGFPDVAMTDIEFQGLPQ